MTPAARVAVVMTLAVSLTPAVARGQEAASRPFPAVFGGSTADPSVTHNLDASLSLGAAHDDNGNDVNGEPPRSLFEQTAGYTFMSGSLAYGWQKKKVQIGANFGADGRLYSSAGDFVSTSTYGGAGVIAELGRRTRVELNQGVTYSPAYFTGLFPTLPTGLPGSVNAPGADYASSDSYSYAFTTSGSLSHGITDGGTVSFQSSLRHSEFENASSFQGLNAYSVGGRYQQRISRNASLRLGYTYRSTRYQVGAANTIAHDLDIGIDYNRPLSLLRRTHLDFGMGSTLVNQPLDGTKQQLQYQLTGTVGLNHQLTRTWRARLAYNRGVVFVDGFVVPMASDAATASVTGFVNRRIDLSMLGSYTVGASSDNRDRNQYTAYTASARLRFALNRVWAAYAEYMYYQYDIDRVQLPFGVQPSQQRSSVRGGITLWIPLVRN